MKKEKLIVWCDKLIGWLFLGVIFLTPVYFAYFAENVSVFELNKLLVVRLGVSLILFLTLLKINLGAPLSYYRSAKLWLIAAGIFLVYVFLGVAFSPNPTLSFIGNYGRQQGIYSLLHYWLFFILLLVNIRSVRQIAVIIYAALSASFLVSVYGILQRYHLDPQPWQMAADRSFSSLGQPNFLGHYLVMVLPLTIAAWWLIQGRKKYYLLLPLLFLQLACLLFTMSRSAWLGLIISLLIVTPLFLAVSARRQRIVLGVAGALMLLLTIGALSYKLVGNQTPITRYVNRFSSSFDWNHPSNKMRRLYWLAAAQEFQQASPWRWLTGFGKDSQAAIFTKQYKKDWGLYEELNAFPDRAHNLIIDCWLEFGILGCLVLVALPVFLLIKAVQYLWQERRRKNEEYYLISCLSVSILSYFFAALFGFSLTTHYLYYYLFLAFLVFLLFREKRHEAELNFFSLAFKWSMLGIIIFFVVFFFYFLTIKAFIADCFYMLAKRAEFNYDCGNALYYANRTLDNFAVSEKLKQDYILLNINCLPFMNDKSDVLVMAQNINDVLGEESRAPFNYLLSVERAHAYSMFGRYLNTDYYGQAEKIYQELIAFNPNITVHYQDYARMKIWAGDYEAAEKIIQQGLEVTPPMDSGWHQTTVNKQRAYFMKLLNSLADKLKVE